MKSLLMPLLFLTLLVFTKGYVAVGQTETSDAPFSLAVSALDTTAEVGEDLKVEVTITNISGHDHFCETSNAIPFLLVVRDSGGSEVPLTPQGFEAYHPRGGSSFAALIDPGKSIRRQRLLNKDFVLTKPGTYTVQAVQELSKTTIAKSNVVTITIVP